MIRTSRWFAALALAGAIALGGADAQARPGAPRRTPQRQVAQAAPASCTVTEILASSAKKGIDPRLARLKAKLSRPPFSAWDSFQLLAEQRVSAERNKPATARLVNGAATILYKDKLVSQGGKARLRFGIDIDDKDGRRTVSTVVVFDSGDQVLIAGQPYKKGTYILALGCSAP